MKSLYENTRMGPQVQNYVKQDHTDNVATTVVGAELILLIAKI